MAKVSFSKLGLSKNTEIKNFEYNGQNIEVKQYLPINDKAIIVSNVLNQTFGDGTNRYINPLSLDLSIAFQIIEYYTNISFTEKQKENPAKLFDLIVGSGLWTEIINNLNKEDYDSLLNYINEAIESLYKYYNSVYGILDGINQQYKDMDLDATKIQKKLADPENMTLLKDVMTQLG